MSQRTDWASFLFECRKRVQEQIAPLLEIRGKPQPILGIGAGGDQLKHVDLAAEKAIVETLRKHELSFTLVSEESGIQEYGKIPHTCYVTTDPIDGSTNLARGIPFYATSIAISTEPIISAIHSALIADLCHGTTYIALRSQGSYKDGRRITPSENTSLKDAVIGIDLNSYKIPEIIPRLNNIVQNTKHIRHLGANALELCYVVDGTTDAFIDIRGKLRATDIAAAWLIVEEAGGIVTTLGGKPLKIRLDPKQRVEFIASANPTIHEILLDLIESGKETEC